ncbi:peptidase M48 [Rhodophyticola sp. CCM32]|nr:peptidase M48 [Rhodophyticola sp. CCM32]
MASCLLMLVGWAAEAQSIIRDAEIERGLRELAAPVLRAAGLPASTRIIIINDRSLNAFVADARHIFIHSGLLMRMEDPAELQAVLAHEAAHIANGHLSRRPANARSARSAAALGLLLAVAAGSASGNGELGAGIAIGTNSSAVRVFLAHTRAEETSADQAGLRYMVQAGIDPAAMLSVLDLFRGQEALSTGRQDPYMRTHPLTRTRLRNVQAFVNGRSGTAEGAESTPEARYWFARINAKLSGFLNNPAQTLRRVGRRDEGEIATLTRAIAYHQGADASRAISEVGRLLQMRPNDPYYQELQGQILYESRNFPQAVRAYARAAQLAPREALILAGHGRALLAADTSSGNAQARTVLERAYARDPFDPRMLRDLALAYARGGNNGMASVVTAERYAIIGRMEDAEIQATRASGLLPNGSGGWLRAQDVLRVAEIAQSRRNRR